MPLVAYQYMTRSGVPHLRCKQTHFSEQAKERLHRVGSPARWMPADQAWNWPLTAAAVIALDRAAQDLGESIEWQGDLKQFAEQHVAQSAQEHEVRIAIERIIREGTPLDAYITRLKRDNGEDLLPARHQQISYHWSQRVSGLLLAHEPGCISGDAALKVRRGGKVFSIALRDLYLKFNRIRGTKYPWEVLPGGTTTKSLFPDGVLRHQPIRKVISRGVKATVIIKLTSGKTLRCTADHEIAIEGGWKRADSLTPGSIVFTNGIPSCPECGSIENIIYYKYSKFRGLCRRCSHRGKRNGRWIRGQYFDKSGYVLISNQFKHPHRDKDGSVREHILVMEKKLGRFLKAGEVVHHKNSKKDDNRISNLELLTKEEHHRLHGQEHAFLNMDGGRAGTGGEIILVPRKDTVVSVSPAGEIDVYDLVMPDPARNFVANGVIVHNCGKTRSASDASGGWYRNGLIRTMSPAMVDGKPGVEGGVLVVCPKTMLKTWEEELRLWQSASSVIVIGSANWKMRRAAMPSHYHITNYESLKYVAHNKYDAIIIDEIHKCANNTNQTMFVLGIAQRSRKKIGLSGTPIANHLESIFYPMLILDGGKSLGSSRTAFLEKYFYTITVGGGFVKHKANADAEQRIAAAMAESTYFVKKAEVLDLPEKTHTPIYLEMTDEQARYYRQIKEDAITYIQDASVTVEQASARMMKLLQICQGFALVDAVNPGQDKEGRHFTDAKSEALMDLLTDTLSQRKVIVWAYFTYEIQRLTNVLTERQIPFVRIDGTVKSQRERDAAQDRWNKGSDLRVYVRQLSMGEGVTLHAKDSEVPCFDTVYLGLSYKMIDWVQTQDRIHRIGQRFACNYTYLLTEDGIDRRVYDSVLDKNAIATRVQQMGKDHYLDLLK